VRSGKVRAGCRAHSIWHKPCPIVAAGAQERLSRCRTFAEAAGVSGADLSFVPPAEQRLWRTVMRTKYQLRRNKVRLHNQLEALLEEGHIKLSSLVSDLLGASARRMLQRWRMEKLIRRLWPPWPTSACAPRRRSCAMHWCVHGAQPGLPPVGEDGARGVAIDRAADRPTGPGDGKPAPAASGLQSSGWPKSPVSGDSAQQIIAEVGAKAATFPSAKNLSSWVGACPGEEESAGVNNSPRSPKGNRHMRRLLNQAANAAAKRKGSIFEIVYRRLVPRLGHNKTIGAIAHRICQLIWIILNKAFAMRNGARQFRKTPDESAPPE